MTVLNKILRDIYSNIGIIDTYDDQIRGMMDSQEYYIENIKDLEARDYLHACDKECGDISDERFQKIMDENKKLRDKLREMPDNGLQNNEELKQLRVQNVDQFEKILLMQSQLDDIDDNVDEDLIQHMKTENESLRKQLDSKDSEILRQQLDSKNSSNTQTPCDDITRENEDLKQQLLIIKTKSSVGNDNNLQDEVNRLNEMIQSSDCLKDLDECKQRLQIFKDRNGGKEPIIVDTKSTIGYFDTIKSTGILGLFLSLISEMKLWKDTDITSEDQLVEMIKKAGGLDDSSMELFISLMRKYNGDDWYKIGRDFLSSRVENMGEEFSSSISTFDFYKETQTTSAKLKLMSELTTYNLQKYVSFIPMVTPSVNNSNYVNRKIMETYISNIYSSNPYIENNTESRDAYIKKIYTFAMKQMKARKMLTDKHVDLLVNPTDLKETIVYETKYDREQRRDVSVETIQKLSSHKDLNTMRDLSLAGTQAIKDGPLTLAVIESIRLQIEKENGKTLSEKWSLDNLVKKGVEILENDIWKKEKSGNLEFTVEIDGNMETINPYEIHYDMFKNGIDKYMYYGFNPPLQTGIVLDESTIGDFLVADELERIVKLKQLEKPSGEQVPLKQPPVAPPMPNIPLGPAPPRIPLPTPQPQDGEPPLPPLPPPLPPSGPPPPGKTAKKSPAPKMTLMEEMALKFKENKMLIN